MWRRGDPTNERPTSRAGSVAAVTSPRPDGGVRPGDEPGGVPRTGSLYRPVGQVVVVRRRRVSHPYVLGDMRAVRWSDVSEWYEGIGLWEPPERWFRRHKRSKIYEVRVAVEPTSALDAAWRELVAEHRTEDGFVLDGGASLERVGEAEVEVVSGGEDGLGSLAWSINATLGKAVLAADPDARLAVTSQRTVKTR